MNGKINYTVRHVLYIRERRILTTIMDIHSRYQARFEMPLDHKQGDK